MSCLTKLFADKFLNAIRRGDINPDKLSSMESDQRRSYLSKYVGKDNAKWVNTELESKFLLKNQQRGMITWAKKVAGISEPARRDIISKINRMETALTSAQEASFLNDLVERRLGIQVSEEEAGQIFQLSQEAQKHEKGTKEYGKAKQKLVAYMREHSPLEKLRPVADTLAFLRSVFTGFDLSAPLRQGRAYFGTKQWNNAFVNMFKYAKNQSSLDQLEADIYGSEYSEQLLKVKKELGLTMLGESFTQREEEFASRLVDKVPVLRGSGRAYEGFLNDLRFNRFVDMVSALDKAGNPILSDEKALKDMAKVIGASSGRGTLGSAEGAAKALATAMFSPRWVASRVQVLLNPVTKRGPAQKEAALALARTAGVSVAILGLAKMMGADADDDTRSSNFGKIKIGNTRYDVTGGMGSYITLLSRLIQKEVKSSTTGKVTKLGPGFADTSAFEVLTGFLTNKASPAAAVLRDYLKGETFEGEPFDIDQPPKKILKILAKQLVVPLIYQETMEAFKEASGPNKIVTGAAAFASSMFGVSVGTYSWNPRGKKWDELKERSPERYKSLVERRQSTFRQKMLRLQNSPRFIAAPETGDNSKASMIDKITKKLSKR